MGQSFEDRHAASLARIAAGTDVLVARVTVNDVLLTVRADQVGLALHLHHGTPTPGLAVTATIKYETMPKSEFDALPDWH